MRHMGVLAKLLHRKDAKKPPKTRRREIGKLPEQPACQGAPRGQCSSTRARAPFRI